MIDYEQKTREELVELARIVSLEHLLNVRLILVELFQHFNEFHFKD